MKRKLEEDSFQADENGLQEESQKKLEAGPPAKTSLKKKKTSDAKDFSGKEIVRLRETESRFHSGFFKLQVAELLRNVSVKQKLKARIEAAIEYVTKVLKKLPEGQQYTTEDLSWLESSNIKVPFVEKAPVREAFFAFLPPSDVKVIGSVATGTMVKPQVYADLVMVIPKAFFHAKDFLNQRYSKKLALYLAAVASHLSGKKRVKCLDFSYQSGNPYKPMLEVEVKGADSKSVTLHLHAVPETSTFRLSRFHMARNNIRLRWFLQKGRDVEEKEASDSSPLPQTKVYNSSILHDLCLLDNFEFIRQHIQTSDNLRQGIQLLKIWLRRRELSQGYGMFSSFLLGAFVIFLLISKKLSDRMTVYQIIKTTLAHLAKADWHTDPPSLFQGIPDKHMPDLEELTSNFSNVFVDHTGHFNLAYMLSSSALSRVKEEAQNSLEALDRCSHNAFDVNFLLSVPFAQKFDHIFHINVDSKVIDSCCQLVEDISSSAVDLGSHRALILVQHIHSVLAKALGKRIRVLQCAPIQSKKWEVKEQAPCYDEGCHLTFGLILDPSFAYNVLEKGPTADSPESANFREFWGEESEMRRFKDGTIHEAVLWSNTNSQSSRRLICQKIVLHVLQKHCGIFKAAVHYVANPLDSLLRLVVVPKSDDTDYGTGEEQSLAVLEAYEEVSKAVRNLSSIPLSVHSVQGIHPVFRHAEVFPALPVSAPKLGDGSSQAVPTDAEKLPSFAPAMTVICMLESSGKWPEEEDAIQAMKALFLIKMGKELKASHLLCVSIHKDYVDVLKGGLLFRLKISTSRELAVLRTVITDTGMVKFKDTDASRELEKETVALPLFTNHLHGIQQEHPDFSVCVRICKRWLGAHMVWDFVPQEVVDLIVAYIFTQPYPFTPPSSPCVGFMRFLNILSTHDWKMEPLMVNIRGEFTAQDYEEIPKSMRKNRSSYPSMCIATPQDKTGGLWTQAAPNAAILLRLVILAKASLKTLEAHVMSVKKHFQFKEVFRPLLEHFDVTIKLKDSLNLLRHQSVDGGKCVSIPQSKHEKETQAMPVVDFNIFQKFLADLKSLLGDLAMVFYDPFGGSLIGLVWRAQTAERKQFRPSNFANSLPDVDEQTEKLSLQVKHESLLDDVRVIGDGIVESINVQCKK